VKNIRSRTGCPYLEALGIKQAQGYKAIDVCLSCKEPVCIIVLHQRKKYPPEPKIITRRYYAQCSFCKIGTEIEVKGSQMQSQARYRQKGKLVYHLKYDGSECGVCKLFKTEAAGRG